MGLTRGLVCLGLTLAPINSGEVNVISSGIMETQQCLHWPLLPADMLLFRKVAEICSMDLRLRVGVCVCVFLSRRQTEDHFSLFQVFQL